MYLAGGATGEVLDELMSERALPFRRVPIAGHTRIAMNIFERWTGLEYRFVPEGPEVTPGGWLECLAVIDGIDADWLVISAAATLDAGGLALVKPSIGEFRAQTGLPLEDAGEIA